MMEGVAEGVATREVYWNIPYHSLLYLFLAPTLAIAAFGLYRKVRLWRLGAPALGFDRLPERMDIFLRSAVAQERTVRDRYAALVHTGLYAGFAILILATTNVALFEYGEKIGVHVISFEGWPYLIFQSLIVDLFGLWVTLAVGLFLWRRLKTKPKQLVYTDESNRLLLLIGLISVTGFVVEGWRIAVTDDPWALWSPVGFVVAASSDLILNDDLMRFGHRFSWWLHMVASFAFIAYAPYTKMAHAITAPLNIFTANLDGYGASLTQIDFETAERLGVNSLTDYSWRDLLDLDACTECGRCTAVCPANTVGKSLSPRDIILDLRKLMYDSESELLKIAAKNGNGNGDSPPEEAPVIPVIDENTAVSPEALFSCTTCAACMEACPVHIEQMPKIIDARRFLVMEEAEFPEGMMEVVTSLESRNHPFPGTQFNRVDWTEGLDFEIDVLADMSDPHEAEVLFWVGCGGALVERNRSTVQATATLLKKAGVKFAILGREESCTGDPARRIGNEFLYEMMAKGNIDTLDRYGVKQVVTSCPHCFNTFENEYPHFGGEYEVHHHSQFLQKLLEEGKLVAENKEKRNVAFHDPCYLGRHNGEFDAPRDILAETVPRKNRMELERSKGNSFCCGGGGGMAFVDEPPDKRVNQERAQEVVDSDAEVLAVGCPFCATMLEDGIGARKKEGQEIEVLDVAEILLASTGPGLPVEPTEAE
ncbi:MAG: heterodisulfide reductase-related iron-sulfur binding cluster [Acidobacteriota bacterium]